MIEPLREHLSPSALTVRGRLPFSRGTTVVTFTVKSRTPGPYLDVLTEAEMVGAGGDHCVRILELRTGR